jgi:hypothetical protein
MVKKELNSFFLFNKHSSIKLTVVFNPLAAGGTHVSISTLPEGHICPKSIDLTTFSLANKIYHI